MLITSCARQNHPSVAQAKTEQFVIPIGFKKAESINKGYVDFFSYRGKQSVDSVIKFYKKNLEFDGWKIDDLSLLTDKKHEGILVCSQSQKTLVIRIFTKGDGTMVNIFLKTAETSYGN